VHGIPGEHERLREGDLVGIDFACFKDGYCADAARTIAVGVVSAASPPTGACRPTSSTALL
jgi:methionyl aminopeptidase